MWQQYNFLARQQSPPLKPIVGISACLTGEQVRYDGKAKTKPELLAQLSPHLQLLPLCPEVAIGMGVPRDPIQLIHTQERTEAVPVDETQANYTTALQSYADQVARHHVRLSQPIQVICGYIFKSRSPSCGLGSSPVYHEGNHLRFGDGIYAHQLCRKLPWLTAMEDEELDTPATRDYFIFRALLTHDFHTTCSSPGGAARFYQHHASLVGRASSLELRKLEKLSQNAIRLPGTTEFLGAFMEIVNRLDHLEIIAKLQEANRGQ